MMEIQFYLSRGLEAQTDALVVAGDLFLGFLAAISCQNTLLVLEYGGLFLVRPLSLQNRKQNKK